MNSAHDLGGMHGFGPIVGDEPERQEFATVWEGRVHALTIALGAWKGWNVDQFRQAVETLPGTDYHRLTYYERWMAALVNLSIETGLFTREEFEAGKAVDAIERRTPALLPDRVLPAMMAGAVSTRSVDEPSRYEIGQDVRARNMHPLGHTRLPRYVRGHRGTITAHHGAHIFADSGASGDGESPQHIYTVRFLTFELWGQARNPKDAIYLNLWESYLEPI
jgi:nitrile hydratase beta subunit